MKKTIAIAVAVLICVVASLFRRAVDPDPMAALGKELGRRKAISEILAEAQAAGIPTDLFGAQWMMHLSEAKNVLPDAVADEEGLTIRRNFYDREAAISLGFNGDSLIMYTITFLDRPTVESFSAVQQHLNADYKRMPIPGPAEGYLLSSRKQVGRFVIRHQVGEYRSYQVEGVQFYRTKEN
jgi:hypothetical protein